MKATYIQRGETIEYKNTSSTDIKLNDVVSLKTRIAVAGNDIGQNETGILHTVGVFSITKASEDITQGTAVYYDESAGNITATAGTNIPAGYAFKDAALADENVLVKLLG